MDREHTWQLPGLALAHPPMAPTEATEHTRVLSGYGHSMDGPISTENQSKPTKDRGTPAPHFDGIIEEWQGPVIALITCQCGVRKGLLWLQAWSGKRLNQRIYALSQLPAMSNTAFNKSLQSTSCQLDRARQELEHLISVSHSPSYAWADLSRGQWRPIIKSPSHSPAFDDWRSCLSQQERWQHYLEDSAPTTVMS